MKINLKCCCGATAVFEDPGLTTAPGIEFGWTCNERGEKYAIETRAREWQERHGICLFRGWQQSHGQLATLRTCCNAECGWKGETDRMVGAVGPLCPECGEVTEPI